MSRNLVQGYEHIEKALFPCLPRTPCPRFALMSIQLDTEYAEDTEGNSNKASTIAPDEDRKRFIDLFPTVRVTLLISPSPSTSPNVSQDLSSTPLRSPRSK